MSLRIAIIADIHHGEASNTKRGDTGVGLLSEFVRFAHDAKADFVLDLGDRISDVDHDTDLRLEREVANGFSALKVPAWHICGNHDRDFISVAENEEILGQSLAHHAFDAGGWRIVLWRADTRVRYLPGSENFYLPEEDVLWLANTLAAADRPVLLASHVPVSGHSMTGNYYFDANPHLSTYPTADRVRAVIAACRQPVTCIAGHVHWNTVTTINGTVHLTQHSVTESCSTNGEPTGAMGLMTLGEEVEWQVQGLEPFACRFTPSSRRWMTPLKAFKYHNDPELMQQG